MLKFPELSVAVQFIGLRLTDEAKFNGDPGSQITEGESSKLSIAVVSQKTGLLEKIKSFGHEISGGSTSNEIKTYK